MSERADWDIVTGVGLTALAVAAGRSVESNRPDRLMEDPYATAFLDAAGAAVPLPRRPEEAVAPWDGLAAYVGVRSRFFDEYFAAAADAEVTQVVLLAAGLDTRSYRLNWQARTVVYELDAPRVLSFKRDVLADRGARQRCDRRAVESDLRENWTAALLAAGFDAARPTAWLAEGLLPFLSDEATAQLFDAIHRLSAPGSRLAAEHVPGDLRALLRNPVFDEMARSLGVHLNDLWPADKTYDPAEWLAGRGWAVDEEPAHVAGERYGRPFEGALTPMRASLFVTGRLQAATVLPPRVCCLWFSPVETLTPAWRHLSSFGQPEVNRASSRRRRPVNSAAHARCVLPLSPKEVDRMGEFAVSVLATIAVVLIERLVERLVRAALSAGDRSRARAA